MRTELKTLFFADGNPFCKTSRRIAMLDTACRMAARKQAAKLTCITEYSDGTFQEMDCTKLMQNKIEAAGKFLIKPIN